MGRPRTVNKTRKTRVRVANIPTAISEEAFVEAVKAHAGKDILNPATVSYCPGSTKHKTLSRAFLTFKNKTTLYAFREALQGYTFEGMEQAVTITYARHQLSGRPRGLPDRKEGTIEKDPDFKAFLARLEAPAEERPTATQWLAQKHEEEAALRAAHGKVPQPVAPLVEFLKKKGTARHEKKMNRRERSKLKAQRKAEKMKRRQEKMAAKERKDRKERQLKKKKKREKQLAKRQRRDRGPADPTGGGAGPSGTTTTPTTTTTTAAAAASVGGGGGIASKSMAIDAPTFVPGAPVPAAPSRGGSKGGRGRGGGGRGGKKGGGGKGGNKGGRESKDGSKGGRGGGRGGKGGKGGRGGRGGGGSGRGGGGSGPAFGQVKLMKRGES